MTTPSTIRIKMIARGRSGHAWEKQLPKSGSFTGECSFQFERDDQHYDWLVVIDDVSRRLGTPPETLPCADEHTLLVTTEPPTITRYGKGFCNQFTHVLTSQPEDALPHPSRIYSHTGNRWFNGHSYNELMANASPDKSKLLSTVCSSKQQKHTIHNERYHFCHWLMKKAQTMNLFGHGSKFIKNKYDALDPYRYHLAIENYSGLHHWTEKLADPYLSGCFPIYYGCQNIDEYFPKDSYLEIDIFNREESLGKICEIINDDQHYRAHREALVEARKRVMEDYNLLKMVELFVLDHYQPNAEISGRKLYGRKQMRCRNPMDALSLAAWHLTRNKPRD